MLLRSTAHNHIENCGQNDDSCLQPGVITGDGYPTKMAGSGPKLCLWKFISPYLAPHISLSIRI